MKAIILLGAPGSGKGTTAERVRDAAGYLHVSTGDMLREAVKDGTGIGREAEGYMEKGELVPDEVMIRLVEERLDRGGPEDSYMFDGFPRTAKQAELLDDSFDRRGCSLTHVFVLEAPRDVLVKRLCGRRICRKCGRNYHVQNFPPKKEGACDLCGGELYQRPDDRETTILNRLDVYNKQTESLIDRYGKKGVLVRVNSNQGADRLVAEVMAFLEEDRAFP